MDIWVGYMGRWIVGFKKKSHQPISP